MLKMTRLHARVKRNLKTRLRNKRIWQEKENRGQVTFELPGVWNFHLDREEKRSQNLLLSLFFNLSNVMFRGNCTVHGGKKKKIEVRALFARPSKRLDRSSDNDFPRDCQQSRFLK